MSEEGTGKIRDAVKRKNKKNSIYKYKNLTEKGNRKEINKSDVGNAMLFQSDISTFSNMYIVLPDILMISSGRYLYRIYIYKYVHIDPDRVPGDCLDPEISGTGSGKVCEWPHKMQEEAAVESQQQ